MNRRLYATVNFCLLFGGSVAHPRFTISNAVIIENEIS
jgi:hypothetical protein